MPEDQEHPGDELLTIAEVCERFDISRTTLHRMRARGGFPDAELSPGSTRPRFRESAVRAFIAAHPKRPGARTDLQAPD